MKELITLVLLSVVIVLQPISVKSQSVKIDPFDPPKSGYIIIVTRPAQPPVQPTFQQRRVQGWMARLHLRKE